jgi:hypothetical protein
MELTTSRKTALSSAGLYLTVSFVAFFPSLVLGKVYFANDLLNQYSHFRTLLRSQLALGHFPLWNPYFFGGQPFFADPNVMMCYPLTYLTLVFPVPYGLGVFFFLHMFLAAWGMHLWLKSLRLSEGACRLAALTFALSGVFWWELIHPPILAAYAWFPWLLFTLEHLAQKLEKGWAFLSGLCFAMVFCCGNFQSTTCVLYTGLFYFFFRLLTREEVASSASPLWPWKRIVTAFLFILWGGLPLASHFIPVYEFSKYTNREGANQTYDHFNGQFSMAPSTSYEFLYPDLGVPAGSNIEQAIQGITDQVNIGNDFLGAFGYLGIWAPFLLALAFKRKEKKFLIFLAVMALLSVLTAWGRYTPLHRLECLLMPGVHLSRAPFRFVQTYLLFACVLLAYGYQTLERGFAETGRRSNWVWAALLYAFLLFVPAFLNPGQTWREMLALGLGLSGFLLVFLSDSWKPLGKSLLLAALLFPLLLSGWSDFSLGPASNFNYEENFPTFTYLKENSKDARYYFDQSLRYPVQMGNANYLWTFPQDAPMELGIRDSAGYNPIYLLKPMAIRSLPLQSFVRLMAIKGFLMGRDAGEIKGFNHQTMGQVHYYGVETPTGFVMAPSQWKVLPDDQAILDEMKNPDFDPTSQVFFSEPPPPALTAQLTGQKASLQYDWVTDDMNEESFHIRLDRDSWVVFSEVMFPGWKAQVDGKPSEIFTGNSTFRTLFIPAGDHLAEFRYEPAWAQPLLIGFILWMISALGYTFYSLRSRPNPAKPVANA